jgi:hypothetical protein
MKEDVRKMILSVSKWSLIAIVAAIAFYQASPKYFFTQKGTVRCNRFTGESEQTLGLDPYGSHIFGLPALKEAERISKAKQAIENYLDKDLTDEDSEYDPRDDEPCRSSLGSRFQD